MRRFTVIIVWAMLMSSTYAENHNDIVISKPVIRETKTNVAAGYLVIQNNSEQDDKLIAVNGEITKRIMLHDTKIQDGSVKMIHLHNGIVIPAGEEVTLQPNQKHLMFLGIQNHLKAGQKYNLTLVFQNAGEISTVFEVQTIAQTLGHNH